MDLSGSDSKIRSSASNGCLQTFLKRHTIVFGTMSGERADVDNTVVDDWVKKLPENNLEKWILQK